MTSVLELKHHYPLPPEQLRAMLVDAEYLRERLAAVGGSRGELVSREEHPGPDASTGPGTVTVVVRQFVARDQLPSIVRTVLGEDLRIDRTETWRADGTGTVTVAVDAPGEIGGTLRLRRNGADGSVLERRIETRVSIPLVGRKAEDVVISNVRQLLDAEHEFTLAWLNEHRR